MAFAKASGYTNLNSGNFSPVIFSQKAQKEFRKSSVVEDITNTDYMGEIANFGDSVRIIKEPDITISTYARGTTLSATDLTDLDFTMTIDQANYYMFKIDDIEVAHSHINFMDLATDRAAYKLRDAFDSEVLGYLSGYKHDGSKYVIRVSGDIPGTKANSSAGDTELLAANRLSTTTFGGTAGSTSASATVDALTSIPIHADGTAVATPLELLNRIGRLMDSANVDTADRWFVADPVFYEILMDESSKFVDRDFGGGSEIRNGRVGEGLIRGFRTYKSNNLPFRGTGPATIGSNATTGSQTNFGVVVAGHMSAVSTAQQLAKTESYRSHDTFSDTVRGMQLYGRKILRPEAIFTAHYNLAK